MGAYYNEIDPYAGQWLADLANNGLIAPGRVDTRSITDVEASDLVGASQAHFFAGIGGWSLALRIAGVPDDAPVWTGSCPCQPFSSAGKRRCTDDDRHLWPVFRDLIADGRPALIFGEQVASRAGRDWLAAVLSDLEGMGYFADAADLCAAGVGAPHIRQRLFWGAANTCHIRRAGQGKADGVGALRPWGTFGPVDLRALLDRPFDAAPGHDRPPALALAHGVPNRVGRLRAYGNAIVPQVAAVFVRCFLDDVAEMFSGAPCRHTRAV